MKERLFHIKGMDCADCALKIKRAVSKILGVKHAEISFATSKLKVLTDTSQFDFGAVISVIKGMGYSIEADKVEAVRKLKERFGKVAMVGDGINDAPAMAVSDVGIAMGAAGTDIAIETGDIVLMSDDLSKIDYALRLSRRTISNIRQNITVSLAIVAFLVPMALIGWIGLVPGLLLNEASGLIAIVNALRLLN